MNPTNEFKGCKTTKSTPRKDDNFGEIQKPKRKMLIIRHLFNAVYVPIFRRGRYVSTIIIEKINNDNGRRIQKYIHTTHNE